MNFDQNELILSLSFISIIWSHVITKQSHKIGQLHVMPVLPGILSHLPFKLETYCISSVIRQSFFFFQNNPKDLDPSCKTDLDLLDCLGRVNLVL